VIAAAALAGEPWQVAAQRLGIAGNGASGPSAAVRGFWRLVRRRGGWWSPVWAADCPVCGEALVARQRGQTLHPACTRPRTNAIRRARRAAGELPKSTAGVRRWRERNPGRDLALRIADRFRARGPKKPQSAGQKAAHSRAAVASRQRLDAQLRELAERHGDTWSAEDDRWLVAHQDWSARAAAEYLGRTSAGVLGRRRVLRERGLLPPRGVEPVEVLAPPGTPRPLRAS
jgi:hypothetical protein